MYFRMALQSSTYSSSSRAGHCEFLEIDQDDLDISHLQAHVVGPKARQQLLSSLQTETPNPSHPSSSPLDEASPETLLADLGRLAPSVAKDFVSKQTCVENLVFRLINDVDFVGDEESYIAISYCWKKVNHDTPRKEVSPLGDLPFGWLRTVEEFPLPTSSEMFQAVLRERVGEGEGVWFDQVCTNQEDEAEKSVALGAIDTIYRNARIVVIALDDIAVAEDEFIFLQHYIEHYTTSNLPLNQQPNRGLHPPFMQRHVPFRTFFEKVISSVWFERAWCAHEMRMGRSHVFLVPCISYEEDETFNFVRFTGAFILHMLVLASEYVTVASRQSARVRSLLEIFSKRVLGGQLTTRSESNPSLVPETTSCVPIIAETFGMKAGGNPRLPEYLRRLDANRDKTAIALSTSGLPLALRPVSPLQRPSIEDECLRKLLLVSLAARDPVALCTTGTPLQLHDGSVSWLSRPTPLDVTSTHQSQSTPPFSKKANPISQASDGRAEYIQLDLIFLDLPHRNQPNPHFPTHIQKARTFIDFCIQYQIQSHAIWNTWQTPDHTRAPAMRNIFIQTLACVFDCGPHWILDVSSTLPSSSNQPRLEPHVIETLFNPQFLIQNFIQHSDGRTALSLLLNFLSMLVSYGIPWASGATERTHGPLIISSPPLNVQTQTQSQPQPQPPTFSSAILSPHSSHSSHSTPYTPNTPYSPLPQPHKAVIFAPFQHSKALLIAIPDVIKGLEYEGLARGWVLTSMNQHTGTGSGGPRGAVCWTLQGKGVIFGERGFCISLAGSGVAGGGVTGGMERRCHRVYGPGVQ